MKALTIVVALSLACCAETTSGGGPPALDRTLVVVGPSTADNAPARSPDFAKGKEGGAKEMMAVRTTSGGRAPPPPPRPSASPPRVPRPRPGR